MHTISRFSRIAGLTLASALTAALLLSCEEKEPVPVTIDSQPSQIAAEGGSTSFTVTAPGSWTAAVQPASDGTAAAWLTIDPASGEAGEHTVTLTAEANTAEEERTATVIVTSGSSSATVSVSQAGATAQDEPEEPETTSLVKSVNIHMSEYASSYYYEFEYDDQNRVSKILMANIDDEHGQYDEGTYNIDISYQDASASLIYHFSDGEQRVITVETDGNGRVVRTENASYEGTYTMTYDDASGRIAEVRNEYTYSDGSTETIDYAFSWSNDNIDRLTQTYLEDGESYGYVFYYTDLPAAPDVSIDLNWLLKLGHAGFMDLSPHWLGVLGMLGERDAFYALPLYDYSYGYDDDPYDYGSAEYEYTTSDEGRLTGMTAVIPVNDSSIGSATYKVTVTYY